MIRVKQDVRIYEENGVEVPLDRSPILIVESHWNRNTQVVLQIGLRESITVLAYDLKAAIENATNTNWP